MHRVPVSSGHFGHVLNTCERTRGVYVVTMATTDLLLRAFESVVAIETSDLLAGVVYIMREVFSSCHNWRYRSPTGRDELSAFIPLTSKQYASLGLTFLFPLLCSSQAPQSLSQHS